MENLGIETNKLIKKVKLLQTSTKSTFTFTCGKSESHLYCLMYVRVNSINAGIDFSYTIDKYNPLTITCIFSYDPYGCYYGCLPKRQQLLICKDLWKWHNKLIDVNIELLEKFNK